MIYKIIIERKEPNPNFEADYQQWKNDQVYGFSRNMSDTMPQREHITNALICELTEEQFVAVKAAVLETFN